MIQDISPKRLNNEFYWKQPDATGKIICIQGNRVWLHADYDYPVRWDFDDVEGICYRYLFAIDDEEYYLATTESNLSELGLISLHTRVFRSMVPMERALAGFTALHLYNWYQDNRFCGRCGGEMVPSTHQRKLVCSQCGGEVFPRINPAVIVAVTDGDRLLITRYANGPVERFVLIAGFTEIGETAEETVAREVMEEVGLQVKDIRYFGSQPWGVDGNLTLGFFCHLDGADTLTVEESELAEAKWFHRGEIPVPDDQTSLTSEMIRRFAKPPVLPIRQPNGTGRQQMAKRSTGVMKSVESPSIPPERIKKE